MIATLLGRTNKTHTVTKTAVVVVGRVEMAVVEIHEVRAAAAFGRRCSA